MQTPSRAPISSQSLPCWTRELLSTAVIGGAVIQTRFRVLMMGAVVKWAMVGIHQQLPPLSPTLRAPSAFPPRLAYCIHESPHDLRYLVRQVTTCLAARRRRRLACPWRSLFDTGLPRVPSPRPHCLRQVNPTCLTWCFWNGGRVMPGCTRRIKLVRPRNLVDVDPAVYRLIYLRSPISKRFEMPGSPRATLSPRSRPFRPILRPPQIQNRLRILKPVR